jgi:membrane protease YdiL (CAAX protease family)
MVATAVFIAGHLLVLALRGTPPAAIPATLFGLAIAAAFAEELVMRGILLALADRASPPRWRILGAPIGWGGITLTFAFITLHGARPGLLWGVAPAALLYLWLRARTGSLLPPIVAHLLWNLAVLLTQR